MVQYVFVDESGDFGLRGSRFLVVAALVTHDQRRLDRIIRNMRRGKFKKELDRVNEVKASKSSKRLLTHLLASLSSLQDAHVVFLVFRKTGAFRNLMKPTRHVLYLHIARELARHLGLRGDSEIHIDRSEPKVFLQNEFSECLSSSLACRIPSCGARVHHSYSHAWSGLQFADVLAWACFQKFEFGNAGFLESLTVHKDIYVFE